MNSTMSKTVIGQMLLVVCCIFYLIWWSISYKPGVSVSRTGGLNGVLLLITEGVSMAVLLVLVLSA